MRKIRRIASIFAFTAAIAAVVSFLIIFFRLSGKQIDYGTAKDIIKAPMIVFSTITVVEGLIILAGMFILQKRIKEKYITPIEAVCVDSKKIAAGNQRYRYYRMAPVYQFTLNGTEYTVEKEIYDNYDLDGPQTGDVKTIYIDENAPDYYWNPTGGKMEIVFIYVRGAIFCAIGASILFFMLSGLFDTIFKIG